jgi:hypothetical protein
MREALGLGSRSYDPVAGPRLGESGHLAMTVDGW